MNNITTAALGAVLAVTVTAGAAVAAGAPGHQLAGQARVTMAQARATVQRLVPNGTIVASELERETGGSGLRYSFDVKTAQGTREVGIDAKTGAVLENGIESPASEQGEGDGG